MMSQKHIILFDGVCNLCNGSVNFVIDRDNKDVFRFAALQSVEGEEVLKNYGKDAKYLDSIVLVKNGKLYQKSSAVLEISGHLPSLWPTIKIFYIIPRFIRDWVYDIIAKNRYSWFGIKEECRIPTPELKSKFLNPEAA